MFSCAQQQLQVWLAMSAHTCIALSMASACARASAASAEAATASSCAACKAACRNACMKGVQASAPPGVHTKLCNQALAVAVTMLKCAACLSWLLPRLLIAVSQTHPPHPQPMCCLHQRTLYASSSARIAASSAGDKEPPSSSSILLPGALTTAAEGCWSANSSDGTWVSRWSGKATSGDTMLKHTLSAAPANVSAVMLVFAALVGLVRSNPCEAPCICIGTRPMA